MLKTAAILKWNMDAYICQDVYWNRRDTRLKDPLISHESGERGGIGTTKIETILALLNSEINKARV
jgi:hypothetical protein